MIMPNKSVAQTPPMGWNSWNMFGTNISDSLLREITEAMVASEMHAVGYEYIVIDDYWHGERDANGNLYPDPNKFPDGMQALSDFVHSKGLKFGLYSDAGTHTCGGCPGSMGYEQQDAKTFAEWGVDYLKYDYCYAPSDRGSAFKLYSKMGRALAGTGRQFVYSICEWGCRRPWLWGSEAGGHLWRTTGDIIDSWFDHPVFPNFYGIETIGFTLQQGLEAYAGPGKWNDPDMLVIGLYGEGQIPGDGCNDIEYRTQMGLWCMLAAPLMVACDLRSMNETTLETLTNPEVIAIDQDPLGRQGYRVFQRNQLEVWVKPLSFGDLAVGLFNRRGEKHEITAHWSDLDISGSFRVRDLWRRQDLGDFKGEIASEVEPHGSVMLRLTPIDI
jgi:alpha-galactosidase